MKFLPLYCTVILLGGWLLSTSCNRTVNTPVLETTAGKTNPDEYDLNFTRCGSPDGEYKGGTAAWLRFLSENCQYPKEAANKEISGKVMIEFIVEKNGTISNVRAIEGPDDLRKEAERVVRLSSGQWQPAMQGGREVRAYKRQPIIFELEAS